MLLGKNNNFLYISIAPFLGWDCIHQKEGNISADISMDILVKWKDY